MLSISILVLHDAEFREYPCYQVHENCDCFTVILLGFCGTLGLRLVGTQFKTEVMMMLVKTTGKQVGKFVSA